MQTARTPLDHMYAIVSLDILEMDKIAQVNFDRFYLNYREAFTVLFSIAKHAAISLKERNVKRNTRRNRGGFSSLLML